jgi:hypothetical protein
LNLTVLNSVLESRIVQAIAVARPSDRSRIDILQEIRAIESYPMKVASFADCLIDYVASLSLELSQRQLRERPYARGPRPAKGDPDSVDDYEQCLQLLKTSPGNLLTSVSELIRQNEHLQRLHKQDRALLIKQNELITSLRREREPPPEHEEDMDDAPCSEEGFEVPDQLAQLRHQFHALSRQLKAVQRRVRQSRRH